MKTKNEMSAIVFGGCGAVGTLFSGLLTQAGLRTVVADLHIPDKKNKIAGVEYIKHDANEVNAHLLEDKTLILFATPEDQTLKAIPSILPKLGKQQCFIDTTSVKTRIEQAVLTQASLCEYISINPMFGPSLGFKHQTVSLINIRPGPLSQFFIQLIENADCKIVTRCATEHDQHTAAVQAATHAAILAFGSTLASIGYTPQDAKAIWTPPHNIMLALLARILSIKPDVFMEIQRDNPYALEAHQHMKESLSHLSAIIESGSLEKTQAIFNHLTSMLADEKESLSSLCQSIFTHIAQQKHPTS
ncbi:prephenate dehydrogenase [Thalassolituus maritimus]|uniref:Prephenate dehydrogenase n=1 Tax=Thalassolituus maritimus TaxID=484498 RepID=A0A1N7Q8Y4_9GAMM|nr:prephenate dehydrogenase/arogenate dehydrogenase family protein [Thalassolituus maritimus]SIT19313.1 prephenate dehydrogenase [Thalassolituus maritimus]